MAIEALEDLADAVVGDPSYGLMVDPTCQYLTGLSMGGSGTWTWAGKYPERWAAIAPGGVHPSVVQGPYTDATETACCAVCGGGNGVEDVAVLKDTPHWVSVGADDTGAVKGSTAMVEKLKEIGCVEVTHLSHTQSKHKPIADEQLASAGKIYRIPRFSSAVPCILPPRQHNPIFAVVSTKAFRGMFIMVV